MYHGKREVFGVSGLVLGAVYFKAAELTVGSGKDEGPSYPGGNLSRGPWLCVQGVTRAESVI